MKRLTVFAGLFLSSSLAIALPLAAAHLYSQRHATRVEDRRLTAHSRDALVHAERTYEDAVDALREVEASHLTTCSPAHIASMRASTFNHIAVSEIGFINKDNFLACTSWGLVDRLVPHGAYTFLRRDGIGVHLGIKPVIVRGNVTIALNLGSHNALVDPLRLTTATSMDGVSIAIANEDGHIVAMLDSPPKEVITYAIQHPGPGALGDYIYSSSRDAGWVSVAVESKHSTAIEIQHQQAILFPIALLMAGALVAGVIMVMRRRLSPLAILQIAVRNREFVPFYQPIMNLMTLQCVGAEALVRWRRPNGEVVTPNFFLPLAEQSRLIDRITDQMIERILDDMAGSIRNDPSLHITINLTSGDIETGRPLSLLARSLEKRRLPASCIWLEATERGFINVEAARETLKRARRQGHVVAIDDFGTGYSSLSLLHSLPLDVLKIDRTFVEAIDTESATSTVVNHIIDMAKGLDLAIIAEGIETEEQAEYLKARNVTHGQGYLYGKPMPKNEFLAFYRSHRKPSQ